MHKTILAFILLILLAPIHCIALDAKYPPYPEVWGYDPYKNYTGTNHFGNLWAFEVDKNEYWFSLEEWNSSDTHIKSTLIKFFESSTQDIITQTDKEKFYYPLFKREIYDERTEAATFSDGSTITLKETDYVRNKCRNEYIYKFFLEKKDASGKVLDRYTVLHILPKPFELIEGEQLDECPAFAKGKIYLHATAIDAGMIGLPDDTFLLYSHNGAIVRLDKDFKTKYDSKVDYTARNGTKIKTNIAVIPTKVIEDMRAEIRHNESIPFQETIHNKLLEYISKNY